MLKIPRILSENEKIYEEYLGQIIGDSKSDNYYFKIKKIFPSQSDSYEYLLAKYLVTHYGKNDEPSMVDTKAQPGAFFYYLCTHVHDSMGQIEYVEFIDDIRNLPPKPIYEKDIIDNWCI